MSAAATHAGAAPNTAVDWHSINWKKVYRTVRRLQARIVKAVAEGRWNKVKALVYLCTFPENTEPAATGQGVVSADFSTPTGERPSRARRGSPR